MASLIVNLHEIINDYIKNARDKELAGKIASEVLVRSKEVVKNALVEPNCKAENESHNVLGSSLASYYC